MCTDDVYCPLPPVFPARLFSIRDEVTPPLFGWKRRPVWTVCGLQSRTTAERISHRVLSYTWSCMSWNPPLNNAWPVRVGRQSLRGAETWDWCVIYGLLGPYSHVIQHAIEFPHSLIPRLRLGASLARPPVSEFSWRGHRGTGDDTGLRRWAPVDGEIQISAASGHRTLLTSSRFCL